MSNQRLRFCQFSVAFLEKVNFFLSPLCQVVGTLLLGMKYVMYVDTIAGSHQEHLLLCSGFV